MTEHIHTLNHWDGKTNNSKLFFSTRSKSFRDNELNESEVFVSHTHTYTGNIARKFAATVGHSL